MATSSCVGQPASVGSAYESGGMITPAAVLPSLPSGEAYMNVHNIIIVIIFCVVCFLLLVAFFFAFCLRCTLQPSVKDSRPNTGCNMEREDATYRRSSSSPSLGNIL